MFDFALRADAGLLQKLANAEIECFLVHRCPPIDLPVLRQRTAKLAGFHRPKVSSWPPVLGGADSIASGPCALLEQRNEQLIGLPRSSAQNRHTLAYFRSNV